jgi:hypothetical protein
LNQGPAGLQPDALPLSYIPTENTVLGQNLLLVIKVNDSYVCNIYTGN